VARFFDLVSTWILIRRDAAAPAGAAHRDVGDPLGAVRERHDLRALHADRPGGGAARRGLNPVPFLIALATSANIGSVMTLTGNPAEHARRDVLGDPLWGLLSLPAPGRSRRALPGLGDPAAGSTGAIWKGSFKVEGLELPGVDGPRSAR
jgi:hypothetical protein